MLVPCGSNGRKSGILIPPIGWSSTSGSQKRPCTPTPEPEFVKKDVATCDSNPPLKKKRPTTPKKKGSGKPEPKEPADKAIESKGKAAPKQPSKSVWTSAHSKFEMGKPMLSKEELASARVNTRGLMSK